MAKVARMNGKLFWGLFGVSVSCFCYRATSLDPRYTKYIMLKGVNDSLMHAEELAALIRGRVSILNLVRARARYR